MFGQFGTTLLPAAVFVLERSRLAPGQRGDPVLVSRALSAAVNDVDEDGVVAGNW